MRAKHASTRVQLKERLPPLAYMAPWSGGAPNTAVEVSQEAELTQGPASVNIRLERGERRLQRSSCSQA